MVNDPGRPRGVVEYLDPTRRLHAEDDRSQPTRYCPLSAVCEPLSPLQVAQFTPPPVLIYIRVVRHVGIVQ